MNCSKLQKEEKLKEAEIKGSHLKTSRQNANSISFSSNLLWIFPHLLFLHSKYQVLSLSYSIRYSKAVLPSKILKVEFSKHSKYLNYEMHCV